MSERAIVTAKTPDSKTENSASQTKRVNFSHSINSPIDQILFLQRTVGNQAVQGLLKSGVIQAKLTIGQPGDIYEQEADRVAEQVMRMSDLSEAQRKRVSEDDKFPRIQRMCTECEEELQRQTQDSEPGHLELGSSSQEELHRQPMEEEEELLQTKEVSGSTPEVTSSVESQINSIRGGGQPLSESVRAFFEPRFGQDFSQVRIHTDSSAGESAKAVNALAYSVGQDVVFGSGQCAPETAGGERLLAHELVHTIQQSDGMQYTGQPHLQRSVENSDYLVSIALHADPVLEAVSRGELFLQFGARGEAVRKIQEVLMGLGFPLPRFGADGVFGVETKGTVVDFQKASGLSGEDADGIVGPITLGLLVHSLSKLAEKKKQSCPDLNRPIDDSEPVFMCSAPLSISIFHHAFFRVGSEKTGCGPTYSLFPVLASEGCVQGRPDKNAPSDLNESASCTQTSIKWSCLEAQSSQYPWGFYCPLGPNSNTYVGVLARACGDETSVPPGGLHPGFDASEPKQETGSHPLFAFALGVFACGPISCGPKGKGH